MSKSLALIVDDERDIRELLCLTLGRMDLHVVAAANVAEARRHLSQNEFALCLTDMRLPDGSGQEIVELIAARHPDTPVAMITAHGNVDAAVSALKAGAFDFVSKPVDIGVLRRLVHTALKLSETRKADQDSSSARMVGDSMPMEELRATITKVARSQAPVYIAGESGVGKELAARLIHDLGPRSGSAFVPVNCGAIPTELMESEFFGHRKGSFTGAHADKQGLFQAANGGTLFLDEIAELPMQMQVKLLRVIQEKAVRPIGSDTEIPVDVRILSATHKDLAAQVAQNNFRQDLFYRIHVIELRVPPLRERREDIAQLVTHMLARHAGETSRPATTLTDSALQTLMGYAFPGNVRELENILERAVALCEGGTIDVVDLHLTAYPSHAHGAKPNAHPETPHAPVPAEAEPPPRESPTGDLASAVAETERSAIMKALEATRWNRTLAARRLGLTLRQLRYRLEKLDIE